MKGRKMTQQQAAGNWTHKKRRTRILAGAAGAAAVLAAVLGWSGMTGVAVREDVYAAAEEREVLPSGIAGVLNSVTPEAGREDPVLWVGSSCENVLVGQRVSTVRPAENKPVTINVSTQMESAVNKYASAMQKLASSPRIMSDKDYDSLLRIVESEAGIEDIKGKILVANVIMNRVANDAFPDTVYDVVWQNTGGVPQFSPTYDGRIYRVKVTDETREAVKQAMNGVDYSEGALFFMAKSAAEEHNVNWFEKDLKRLFKYGYHEFYTIPESVDMVKADAAEEEQVSEEDAKVAQASADE